MRGGLFDRERTLRLMPDYLEYDNKDLVSEPFTRVRKEDMADISYSADWNIWYRFYVGSTYRINIKTKDHRVLRVKFTSYFSANEKVNDAYDTIVNLLWEYYLEDIVTERLEEFEASKKLQLAGFTLTEHGVTVPEKKLFIEWGDVELKEYEAYHMVYNRQQPTEHQDIRLGEWGSEVLYSIIKKLKKRTS